MYEGGVTFRHGQLVLLAGQPGSGKSLFSTWLANQWDLPTLVFSMDTSQVDTTTRVGAMRCNMTDSAVKAAFEDDGPEAMWIEEELSKSLIDCSWDDSPVLDDFLLQLQAYVEAHDHYPSILLVDNLIDIDTEGADEYSFWNQALLWFKSLARETGMTIFVVHHARELDKADYPAPRKDFAGKPGRTPELMLSVSMTADSLWRVSVVKNRTGPQDAQARTGWEFAVNAPKVQFRYIGKYVKPEKGAA